MTRSGHRVKNVSVGSGHRTKVQTWFRLWTVLFPELVNLGALRLFAVVYHRNTLTYLLTYLLTCMSACVRDELDAEEYAETRNDTLDQLREFGDSLSRMKEGNLSLVDDINRMQLVSNCLFTLIIFSIPRDGQLDLLQDIFRLCVRVKNLRLVFMLTGSGFGWRPENSACRVYLSVMRSENNTEHLFSATSIILSCNKFHNGDIQCFDTVGWATGRTSGL